MDKQARALAKVTTAGERWRAAATRAAKARGARDVAIRAAIAAGVPRGEVAAAAGMTPGRVTQVVDAATFQLADDDEDQGDDDGAAGALVPVPPLPPSGGVSTAASTRQLVPYTARVSAWVAGTAVADDRGRAGTIAPWSTAGELLRALPPDVARVYLIGAPPESGHAASRAERVRAWGQVPPGHGWRAGEHFTRDTDAPVFRFTHEGGRAVELHSASGWFGDEPGATPKDAAHVWAVLGQLVARAFSGGQLLATPATTGRDLWRRTIPAGRSFPVLPTEVRELIHATAGQGRSQVATLPELATVPGFVYTDGRLMYAALTWGMPVGEPVRWTAAGFDGLPGTERQRVLRGRGRWSVVATVPPGWAHLGLLMAPDGHGGWTYPDRPGQRFATWADGSEVWLALSHGWHVEVREGITWAEGKPLDTWTRKLVTMREQLGAELDGVQLAMGRNAVRSMLLFGLGAMTGRRHPVTRELPYERGHEVPGGVAPRLVGDTWTWEQDAELPRWVEEVAHPEWVATVWARARVRLLAGPDGTGALALPRAHVLGLKTDALYLSADPGWTDTGRVGAFRVKGKVTGTRPAPHTYAALYALRDESEGNTR